MNLENRATGSPGETPPAPKKSTALLGLAVVGVAALGLVALMRPSSPEAGQPTPAATSEVRLGGSGDLTAAPQNPLSSSYAEPQLVLFVPGEGGEMSKRTLPAKGDIPKDAGQAREKLTTQAVQALMQAEPTLFPSGATLSSAKVENGVTSLDFNAAFTEPSFWQGSARTTAVLDALSMTVDATQDQLPGAAQGGKGSGLRILAGGKSVATLGEMDMSEPYTASAPAPAGSDS